MNNIRPFQMVLLGTFALLAVIALVFLSVYQTHKKQQDQAYGAKVTIWGTLPSDAFKSVLQEISHTDKAINVVTYKQIDQATFQSELVNAIADGKSPDMIVLGSDSLVSLRSKLLPISYNTIPERTFLDSYVDGASLFSFADGIYGVPFAVDPLVMYWNRDMFSSSGIALPPATWESLVTDVVPRLTIRDSSRNVLKSAVSFGEYRNVMRAKDMLMLLLLQSGSKMVTENKGVYKVTLDDPIVTGTDHPFASALQFYTEFSNVNSTLYSWNRAKAEDKDVFLSGDLGLYFGRGSEYNDIATKNPNLSFDMTAVPQGANATALRTYGEFYAFAFPKAAQNARGAFAVAQVFSQPHYMSMLVQALHMAPAQRALIAQGDADPYRKVILKEALIARAWLDPDPAKSDSIFMQMVEDVVSNRSRVSEAVIDAINRLTMAY